MDFVVGDLDFEFGLQCGEQSHRVDAIDAEGVEEILLGRKPITWPIELACRKVEKLGDDGVAIHDHSVSGDASGVVRCAGR